MRGARIAIRMLQTENSRRDEALRTLRIAFLHHTKRIPSLRIAIPSLAIAF
jgi:hypothetical protein